MMIAQEILNSPEFWMSCAFVLVIVAVFHPVYSYVRRWGEKEASDIQHSLQEAREIRKKAEALVETYETAVRRHPALRREALAAADVDIATLQKEMEQQVEDKILHQKQEVALRLKMIEENGRQDVKKKMLGRVLVRTEQKLVQQWENGDLNEDMDMAVDRICAALTTEVSV